MQDAQERATGVSVHTRKTAQPRHFRLHARVPMVTCTKEVQVTMAAIT